MDGYKTCHLGPRISGGSYGNVYESSGDGQTVLKVSQTGDLNSLSIFEIDTLFRLQSPYLLRGITIYDAGECGASTAKTLRLELCNGTVKNFIDTYRNGNIPYYAVKRLMLQYALGLRCLHRQGLLHLDLSENNFMYRLDEGTREYNGVIVDFGMGVNVGYTEILSGNVISRSLGEFDSSHIRINPMARPPENFQNPRHYTMKADIWSLGILYLILAAKIDSAELFDFTHLKAVNGVIDYDGHISRYQAHFKDDQIIPFLRSHLLDKTPSRSPKIPESEYRMFENMLLKMLKYDPNQRITIEHVVDSQFFTAIPPGWPYHVMGVFNFKDLIRSRQGDACDINQSKAFVPLIPFNSARKLGVNFVLQYLDLYFSGPQSRYQALPVSALFVALDLYLRMIFGCGPQVRDNGINIIAFLAVHFTAQYYINQLFVKDGHPFYAQNPTYQQQIGQLDIKALKLLRGIVYRPYIYESCSSVEELFAVLNDIFDSPNFEILTHYLILDIPTYLARKGLPSGRPKTSIPLRQFIREFRTVYPKQTLIAL